MRIGTAASQIRNRYIVEVVASTYLDGVFTVAFCATEVSIGYSFATADWVKYVIARTASSSRGSYSQETGFLSF